ncbi:hypothetical protein LZK98_08205 [Sphingomonas cannabina]|uniref:hypothetical protein n=1 Tax=Sphingomonas cannabina TaxID=2899123 RepID=UPI001F181007|nr:hypothetical protein [Sphingomonas cannabina]UIJ46911.1 hypothetical protein LZK98_08205 [Sphingomonas cannabina]
MEALIENSDASMAALSKMLDRNPAYIQQYLRRGSPKRLPEDERGKLARFFGVDERDLGAREPWRPKTREAEQEARTSISRA